jgi:hypothetical protein
MSTTSGPIEPTSPGQWGASLGEFLAFDLPSQPISPPSALPPESDVVLLIERLFAEGSQGDPSDPITRETAHRLARDLQASKAQLDL